MTNERARFTMIVEDFICRECGYEVKALGYTARDHCPKCLKSIHIDINPGDRACDCFGTLIPISIEPSKKDTYKIVYTCDKCGTIKRNKTAFDDDMDKIIQIMSNPVNMKELLRKKK